MTELNEYECELLDVLLEAFGVPDSLTRKQVMELFDQDEAAAFAMVQILLREELVAETGNHGDFDLPEKLILKPKGDKFLKSGGFTRRYKVEQAKPVEVGGTLSNLQQQSLALENQRLLNGKELGQLRRKVKLLTCAQLLWLILVIVALIVGYRMGHAHPHVK